MCTITKQITPDTTNIPSGAPSVNEINIAIKRLKSNKASGLDNVPPELFKTYPNTITNILESLLNKVWKSGQIPNEWKQGLIIKLPKKGDLSAATGGE
jgi:hypothetical protein